MEYKSWVHPCLAAVAVTPFRFMGWSGAMERAEVGVEGMRFERSEQGHHHIIDLSNMNYFSRDLNIGIHA